MGDTPRDRMKQREAEIRQWEKVGEKITPSQRFDIISDAVQTVPTPWTPTPTLHQKPKSKVKYRKGGFVDWSK